MTIAILLTLWDRGGSQLLSHSWEHSYLKRRCGWGEEKNLECVNPAFSLPKLISYRSVKAAPFDFVRRDIPWKSLAHDLNFVPIALDSKSVRSSERARDRTERSDGRSFTFCLLDHQYPFFRSHPLWFFSYLPDIKLRSPWSTATTRRWTTNQLPPIPYSSTSRSPGIFVQSSSSCLSPNFVLIERTDFPDKIRLLPSS